CRGPFRSLPERKCHASLVAEFGSDGPPLGLGFSPWQQEQTDWHRGSAHPCAVTIALEALHKCLSSVNRKLPAFPGGQRRRRTTETLPTTYVFHRTYKKYRYRFS